MNRTTQSREEEDFVGRRRPAEDQDIAEIAKLYTAGGDGLPPPPLESSETQSD